MRPVGAHRGAISDRPTSAADGTTIPRSQKPRELGQTITHGYKLRRMIDAAGLRVMRAIADEGSFTLAALSLGYSQPAISQMVRRLEQRTGTVLVERVGRHVRLTEAGQVLARHAVGVLAALDAAEEEVAAIAGLRAGRVRLMAFPSSSATLVPRALALVKERFPEIKVTFTEAEPPESLAALRAASDSGGSASVNVTLISGNRSLTRASARGTSVAEDEGKAISRTRPARSPAIAATSSSAASSAASTPTACRASTWPASVRRTLRPTLSTRTVPVRCSRRRTIWEMAGWEQPSERAAKVKLPSSAMSRITRSP